MPKRHATLANDTLTPDAELLFALRPFIDLLARQAVREFVATNDNGVQRADVVCAR
ncbi:hypothetical protein ABHV46_11700 [Asaia sp. BMEF1]|uniref:hypothetical protein n=1 Tax=Asaia sp. BMEF1 TaxID=3155932 RepID=UPI003F667695